MSRDAQLNRVWYEGEKPAWWLRLLSIVFAGTSALRRALYRIGALRASHLPVPVIVIGNLTAGGTGKTPLTLSLVRELRQRGFSPGIVSRGYGARIDNGPLAVTGETSPQRAGDEPVLLARRSDVPVWVHPRRAQAAEALLATSASDVIVCDDGLQHYALARDIEIAVVDAMRGFGNGRLMPAGPLREPLKRLEGVDHVVVNGNDPADIYATIPAEFASRATLMKLQPAALVNLRSGERRAPDALAGARCAALAGIGNPQRFFTTLSGLGYAATCRAFPDHHAFQSGDFAFAAGLPLLMTEKDAVKCREFASPDWWYLEIAAVIDDALVAQIAERLRELRADQRRQGS